MTPVGIQALSVELLDKILSMVTEDVKGPRARAAASSLASVNRAFADSASRRLWRRIVIDHGRKQRYRKITSAFAAQPHHHGDIRHLLIRADVLTAKETTETIEMIDEADRVIELALECRMDGNQDDKLVAACSKLALQRFRLEPPILDEDRIAPHRPVRKYDTPLASILPPMATLRSLELWQVSLRSAQLLKATYRLQHLSLRDVDASPALAATLFAPGNISGIQSLTLDYFSPCDKDDESRAAFAGVLASIVQEAAPTVHTLSLMAPMGAFNVTMEEDGDQAMTKALGRLGGGLRSLTLGGQAFTAAQWAVIASRPCEKLKKLDLGFLTAISPSNVVATLRNPVQWMSLIDLRIRSYEYPVRTAVNGIPYSASWIWSQADLRALRRIADLRVPSLRYDERSRLPDAAYSTAEEDDSEDEAPMDGNAIFELDEQDLANLEDEAVREAEIRAEIRARESSEGDDFMPSSEGDL